MIIPNANPQVPAALRRRWLLCAIGCLAALAGGYAILRGWQESAATAWLLLAGLVAVFQLVSLWRLLPSNQRPTETAILPMFGAGTSLTLLRGLLIALLAGFLLFPRPPGALGWLPAALYILSDFTDFFDGYLARRFKQVTRLGQELDMRFDALGVLVVMLLAYRYGSLPIWYLPVGFARYVFLFGAWIRRRLGRPLFDLPPSNARRGFAGLQMGFLTAMLFPIVRPPLSFLAAALFMTPFLVRFSLDWLILSGVRLPARRQTTPNPARLGRLLSSWFPLLLRGLAAAILLGWSWPSLSSVSPLTFPWIMAVFELLFALLFLTGTANRIVAVISMLALALKTHNTAVGAQHGLFVIAATGLLFLGSGAYSLWKPIEHLVRARSGE